ncbi:hypothetical protein CYJ20_006335 [Winkia neuii]|nr:hypothetical protein [Winkia neuii]MDK8341403.1 hypothetical protein [Winkia sp. UMB3164B]PMC93195.1 hypothetical protein CJ188_05290 [Actinomyces sp. UMB0918]WIK89866.1 hypothetical protein CYJ20_006335 [Winkia neuii]
MLTNYSIATGANFDCKPFIWKRRPPPFRLLYQGGNVVNKEQLLCQQNFDTKCAYLLHNEREHRYMFEDYDPNVGDLRDAAGVWFDACIKAIDDFAIWQEDKDPL